MSFELLGILWEVITTSVLMIVTQKEAWYLVGIFAIMAMYKWRLNFKRRL